MRKLLLLGFILSIGISSANAQIEEGDSMINLGVGFGITFASTSGDFNTTIPPVEASYEYAISEKFTVGGFAGYSAAEFRSNFVGTNFGYDYTYLLAGALGNWQFVNNEKINVYLGGKLGYVNISADEVGTAGIGFSAEASGVVFGGQLGGRYFISDAIAINLEAGYGISAVKAGITIKL